MAKLVSKTTMYEEEIPEDKVLERFLSGKYAFRKGERVPVVAPDGSIGTIPSEKALEAFQGGFAYDVDHVRRKEEREFGDREISAFIAGAGRGATLGLSDVLLTETGLVEEETLRGLEEYNPGASLTGELIGVAAPLLVPEPSSTAGALARIAGTGIRAIGAPVRAAVKVGSVAEKAIVTGVKGLEISNPALKYAAEKIVTRMARGAIEGTAFGAGHAISELALADPKTLAEQTLADTGLSLLTKAGEGALIGGAASGVLGTTFDAAGAAKKVVAPGFEFLSKKIAEVTDREWWRALSAEKAVKSLGPTKGEVKKIMRRLATHKQTEDTMEKIGGIETMGRDLRTEGVVTAKDTVDTSLDKLQTKLAELGAKLEGQYNKLDDAATGVAEGELGAALRPTQPNLLPKAKDFYRFIKDKVLKPIEDEPTLTSIHRRLSRDLDLRMENLGGREQVKFSELWEWRQKIDDTINWRAENLSLQNAYARNYRDAIKNFIIKEGDRVSTYKYAQPSFKKEFLEMNRLYSSLRMASDVAESSVAGGVSNRSASLTDHLSAIMAGSLSGSWLIGLGAGALNKFIIRERSDQIMSAAADKIADLGFLGWINRRMAQRVESAVKEIVEGKPSRVRPAAVGVAVQAIMDHAPDVKVVEEASTGTIPTAKTGAKKRRPDVEAYDRLLAELGALAQDPDRVIGRLTDFSAAANNLSANAPETFSAMVLQAQRSIKYLYDKAPKPTVPASPFSPPWEPTRGQLDSFGKTVQAVNDPFSVLEQIAYSYPSTEGMDALRYLYPSLLDMVQQQLMESFSESRKAPSHRIRVNLGRLFRTPLDPTEEPDFFRSMQESAAVPPEERDVEPVPGPQRPLSPSGERRKSQRISEAMGDRISDQTQTDIGRLSTQ